MLINSNIYSQKTHFKGFKEDFKTSEDVVKKIRQEGYKSITYLKLERKQLEKSADRDDESVKKRIKSIKRQEDKLAIIITPFLKMMYEPYNSNKELIDRFLEGIKTCKVLNCGFMGLLTQIRLSEKGVKSTRVELDIKDTEKDLYKVGGDHSFVVVGLKEDADIKDPTTWGKNAIVVDSWSGLVATPAQAIKQFKEWFNFDKKKDEAVFTEARFQA